MSAAAFVCEPTGHLVHMDFLSPNKSTWTASEDASRYNLFVSKDAWSAPIQTWTGPDGTVWIQDWYN